jgi:hypothetical protein
MLSLYTPHIYLLLAQENESFSIDFNVKSIKFSTEFYTILFIIATNDARANSVLRFEHEHAHN